MRPAEPRFPLDSPAPGRGGSCAPREALRARRASLSAGFGVSRPPCTAELDRDASASALVAFIAVVAINPSQDQVSNEISNDAQFYINRALAIHRL